MANWLLMGGPLDGEILALPDHVPQEYRLMGAPPIAWNDEAGSYGVAEAYEMGVYRRTASLAQRGELHWQAPPTCSRRTE